MSFRTALLAGLAAYAAASPMPQAIDLDGILAQGPPATATIASTPGVITMAVTSLASAAAAEITAAPLPQTTAAADSDISKRDVAQSNITSPACQARPAQPKGAGPVPADDSASGFLSSPEYNATSNIAPVPSGYSLAFNSLFAENNAYGVSIPHYKMESALLMICSTWVTACSTATTPLAALLSATRLLVARLST